MVQAPNEEPPVRLGNPGPGIRGSQARVLRTWATGVAGSRASSRQPGDPARRLRDYQEVARTRESCRRVPLGPPLDTNLRADLGACPTGIARVGAADFCPVSSGRNSTSHPNVPAFHPIDPGRKLTTLPRRLPLDRLLVWCIRNLGPYGRPLSALATRARSTSWSRRSTANCWSANGTR